MGEKERRGLKAKLFLFPETLFAISMSYFEASVVVYLRRIYYSRDVQLFPLKSMEPLVFKVELFREFFSLLMILSIALLGSRGKEKKLQPTFYRFIYIFGIWDLLYYVFLKATIGWPGSLLEWDVLFLIPIVWVAPVLAPFLVAVVFVIFGFLGIVNSEVGKTRWFNISNLILLLLGVFLIFISFVYIPINWLLKGSIQAIQSSIPANFPWAIYIPGLLLLTWSLVNSTRKCS